MIFSSNLFKLFIKNSLSSSIFDKSLENLYDHIDEIKGKTKEKLELDKDSAFFINISPINSFLNYVVYNYNIEGENEDMRKKTLALLYHFFPRKSTVFSRNTHPSYCKRKTTLAI